jgi:flavorubredoxin
MEAIRNLALTCLLLLSSNALYASDLLHSLTSQLGITTEQAAGGAGSLFNLAKSRLSSEDFSQIAAVVPDIDGLIAAAPTMSESASGAVTSMLGGENGLGSLAALASSFSQLGLSSDMISQFTPIILDYLQQVGGSSVMEVMKTALAM